MRNNAHLSIQRHELAEPLLESEAVGCRFDGHGVHRMLGRETKKIVGAAFGFGAFINRIRGAFQKHDSAGKARLT